MVRPSHDLSNIVVGGIRDYAEQLEAETGDDVDPEDAHERLLRDALVDVGILTAGESCTSTGSDSDSADVTEDTGGS